MNDLSSLIALLPIGLLAGVSVYWALKPEKAQAWMLKNFQQRMRGYGFEGEIKAGPKTKSLCRTKAILMLLALAIILFIFFAMQIPR